MSIMFQGDPLEFVLLDFHTWVFFYYLHDFVPFAPTYLFPPFHLLLSTHYGFIIRQSHYSLVLIVAGHVID